MVRTPTGQTRDSVYRFVRERLEQGEPPTLREIAAELGFRAVETAREHLMGLVSEGRLVHVPGQSRGYRLPEQPLLTQLVPLLGRVQAGALVTAVEEHDGYVPVQVRNHVARDELFGLRVRGESMRGAGILPGDIVIVRQQAEVNNGDIVVALVDDEATVKRLRKGKRGCIELHPDNPDFEVIVRPAKAVRLLGKVIEVRRHLEPTTTSVFRAPA